MKEITTVKNNGSGAYNININTGMVIKGTHKNIGAQNFLFP